jgi:EthD domain
LADHRGRGLDRGLLRSMSRPKHFVFLRAAGSPARLQDRALAAFAAAPFDVALNLVQDDAAPWHLVVEAWTDAANLHELLRGGVPGEFIATRATYRVEELIEKDEGPAPGWPVAGVRLIVPWRRRTDVSPPECRRHWDEHVPLALRVHVGVTRYVRNWVEAAVGDEAAQAPAYQGIASQHYPSEQDLRERSFDSPASVQVINDDVAEFIAEFLALQVIEYRRTGRSE